MKQKVARLATAAVLFVLAPALPAAAQSYHVAHTFKLGGDGGWDYLALDGATNRLFIARNDRIMVVDPEQGKLLGEVGGLQRAHGIAFDRASGRGFATSGGDASVVIFDLKTLKTLGRTKVDEDDDAILVDPATGHVFTFNGDAHTASVLDPSSGKVVGTVQLGAKPESGAADGKGKLYVNLESSSEIAEVDASSMKVTRRWPLAPCEGPTGIAIDAAHHVLFSVCRNRIMAMSDTVSGKVVGSVAIGAGADGARYDAETGLAFASTGGDGAVTVVHEDGPTAFTVVQAVKTQAGARTMELDPKTHRLYTVGAELEPPPAGYEGQRRRPTIVPGSFTLLVLER
ncbi:MAG TPA: YncE family protein [Gammaproteobacteria bacterium]|nr:YncE family protein [Gammaproteobacteria bacterium]